MWTWKTDKVNCVHSLKKVEDLRVFLNVALLLVEKGISSTSKIEERLGLDRSAFKEYRLQGRVCYGEGGWCSGGRSCLGRFGVWIDNSWSLTPTEESSKLIQDYHKDSFEAEMLRICLKTVPHFFEFCEMLSYGANILRQYGEYKFRIFQRDEKPTRLNEWQLSNLIYARLRKRFIKGTEIPYEKVNQLLLWAKSLGIIRSNPVFGRLEFDIKSFESFLDKKHIYGEFSKDRDSMEAIL